MISDENFVRILFFHTDVLLPIIISQDFITPVLPLQIRSVDFCDLVSGIVLVFLLIRRDIDPFQGVEHPQRQVVEEPGLVGVFVEILLQEFGQVQGEVIWIQKGQEEILNGI